MRVELAEGAEWVLSLSGDELAGIGGLADALLWSAQPPALREMLTSLHAEASTALGVTLSAAGQGFVGRLTNEIEDDRGDVLVIVKREALAN